MNILFNLGTKYSILSGVASVLMLFVGCLSGGCQKDTMASVTQALQDAKFKGRFHYQQGGSPLGFNASTSWSLGPAQSTFECEGQVDYSQSPTMTKVPEFPADKPTTPARPNP